MSWLFSQALGEEFLAATCFDGAQFAPLNVMPTPHKFWRNDKMMEFSQLSRFGLTCAVLTESHGAELLMWYLEDFHARTSAQQEKEKEFQEKKAVCGRKWQELLAKYSHDTHTWKTAQCSLLADSELFSETWPRWGTMQNGDAYRRQSVAPITKETEYGFWPTPLRSPRDSCLTMDAALQNQKLGTCRQTSLSCVVAEKENDAGRHIPDGHLSPGWVEWLMGWPIGWTDLQPLAMDKFREWQRQHSAS